ncbi:MAG: SUMF1/EgtB/PvdO family nonheme iron enzyme, partial [bacterium]
MRIVRGSLFAMLFALAVGAVYAQQSAPAPVPISEVSAVLQLAPGLRILDAYEFPDYVTDYKTGEVIQNPGIGADSLITENLWLGSVNVAGEEHVVFLYRLERGPRVIIRAPYSTAVPGTAWQLSHVSLINRLLLVKLQYFVSPQQRKDALVRITGDWEALGFDIPAISPTPTPTNTPADAPTATPTPRYLGPTITIPLPDLPDDTKSLEMVLIPAGTFMMGSPENERGRNSFDEELPHEVAVTKPFYLGKYEVTQAQWESLMGWSPTHDYGVGHNYPVYYVSWNDCHAFIERLNRLDQGTFRLPTEAEWEYACRAGTTTRFSFGDALECEDHSEEFCEIADRYMWWLGNNTHGGNVNGSKEVGLKLPNPWGLFDMHGNIGEWCLDPWYSEPQPDPELASWRVRRGGYWWYWAMGCRSAFRDFGSYNERNMHYGFRLAMEYPSEAPVATPTPTLPEHRVLFINIRGNPLHYRDNALNLYQALLWAGAEADYVDIDDGGEAAALIADGSYDQIWVFDLSYETDDHPTDWQAIADWFNVNPDRTIICDGRILSPFRDSRFEEEGRQLAENYYYNLKVRGGGLFLGTDHDNYHSGINTINELIGLEPWVGEFDTSTIPVDSANPLMSIPNDLGMELSNDSSPSQAPHGLQPNGRILYSVGWHLGDFDTPGISSTIEGEVGFHVNITSPPSGSTFFVGDHVSFIVEPRGGDLTYSYTWRSKLDGEFGTGENLLVSTLSPGQHVITVLGVDGAEHYDDDSVVISVVLPERTPTNTPTPSEAPTPSPGNYQVESVGTSFTYQGHLTESGDLANGAYDFEFKLYDAKVGGTQQGNTVTLDEVTVTNGLFKVDLDFGAGVFAGEARYIEIGVRPGASDSPYTTISPRRELTPTPYAIYALSAGSTASQGGIRSSQVTASNEIRSTSTEWVDMEDMSIDVT